MRILYGSIVLSLIFMSACSSNPVLPVPDNPLAEDFVTIWEAFDETYPEFPVKSVDWHLAYDTYYPIAQAAETSDEVMMNAVLPMLAELQDGHVWMLPPGGSQIYTYTPEYSLNYDMSVLQNNYLFVNGWSGWSHGVGYCDPDSLPYLAIKTWPSNLDPAVVDSFIALCAETPAIIIDVRMNSGGSNMMTKAVVGRFTHEECTGWMWRYRTGPGYDDCEYEPVMNLVLGPQQYNGDIILLMGDYCASTTEEFILRMKELPNVTLVGDTTMGCACCPEWIKFSSGWAVTHGIWSMRTTQQEPVEGSGIAPDIYVEATEEEFAQGIDPVLEYAIGMLGDRE